MTCWEWEGQRTVTDKARAGRTSPGSLQSQLKAKRCGGHQQTSRRSQGENGVGLALHGRSRDKRRSQCLSTARQMEHPLGLQTKGRREIPGTRHTKEKAAGAWVGGRFAYWGQSRKLLRKNVLGLWLERGMLPTGTPEGNDVRIPWPVRYQLRTVCRWGALDAVHGGSRQLRVCSTSRGEL